MAVSRDKVDKIVQLLLDLKIKPEAIYHELECLGNLLAYTDNFDPGRTYALINIKTESSEISFYRGRRLEFLHISSVGSKNLAEVPNNQSKYEYFTESLVNEIANALDYYVGQFSNTSADKVFVYGDLSYSDELIGNLSNRFGIEFQRFPVETIIECHKGAKYFFDEISVMLTNVALALNNFKLINFLPPSVKEKWKERRFLKLALPGLMALMFLLLSFWYGLRSDNKIMDETVNLMDKQIEAIQNSETFGLYNRIKNRMAIEQAVLAGLDHRQTYLHLNLKELSLITPEKIKLDMYDLEAIDGINKLRISGKAISYEPPPEIILAEFIARLESSEFYNNIKLKRHVKRREHGEFVIDFLVETEAVL
jgi:hypothetical protein